MGLGIDENVSVITSSGVDVSDGDKVEVVPIDNVKESVCVE